MKSSRSHFTIRRERGAAAGAVRTGVLIAIVLALLAGVAAGAYWRDSLVRLVRPGAAAGSESGTGPSSQPKQLWTCGMHPQVIQDHPGDCPICHMKLTPVRADGTSGSGAGDTGAAAPMAGQVVIDPAVVQNMGVRTATVTEGPL